MMVDGGWKVQAWVVKKKKKKKNVDVFVVDSIDVSASKLGEEVAQEVEVQVINDKLSEIASFVFNNLTICVDPYRLD